MYLYYDSKGTLKEIVNDKAIRAGNSNVNKIKFFIEGADPQVENNVYKALSFISGFRTFIDVENNALTTESFSLTTHQDEIPFNKKRELKYFKYFTKYEFFQITVPDDVLNESGTVGCRIQMVTDEGSENYDNLDSDDTILTLGLVAFNVEFTGGQAVIESDTAINIAQWNYLIKTFENSLVYRHDLTVYINSQANRFYLFTMNPTEYNADSNLFKKLDDEDLITNEIKKIINIGSLNTECLLGYGYDGTGYFVNLYKKPPSLTSWSVYNLSSITSVSDTVTRL